MHRHRSQIHAGLATFLVIIMGFVVPPSVNSAKFRAHFSESLSRSLGRAVSVDEVHVRLLPLPGFTFRHLKIADDPEFGGEPILQTVEDDGSYSSAKLRLGSLWRGRLEIASISLTQASLNLTRSPDGHWNLERLINRASQTPSAPTAKRHAESRNRFPYIELNESRINFKFGQEKKPFTLSDSDFALWLAAENRWNVRLKSVPLRTDEYLSDTGVIHVSGSFDRAASYASIPFHFQFSWDRPQINELVRMEQGRDPGWRGMVDLSGEIKGTPADFVARIDGSVDQFRRYDITRSSSLSLQVSCIQHFVAGEPHASLDFKCRMPVARGTVTAEGTVADPAHFGPSTVTISAGNVPVNAFVQALLHAKSTLPDDLAGTGTIDGNWTITHSPESGIAWSGRLVAHNASLRSAVLSQPLGLGEALTVDFGRQNTGSAKSKKQLLQNPASAVIQPAVLDEDAGDGPQISGELDNHQYRLDLRGKIALARLAEMERLIGGRSLLAGVKGTASLDASYSGAWSFAPATLSGSLRVNSARFAIKGISEPLVVSSANVSFNGPDFQVPQFAASFPGSNLNFTGSAQGSRDCADQPVCDVTFSAHAGELSEIQIASLLQARDSGLSLPFFHSGAGTQAVWLLSIPAKGSLSIQHLSLPRLQTTNVTAQLQTGAGRLLIRHWTGNLFGGRHDGELTLDFSGPRPSILAAGALRHASMEEVATAFDDPIGAGVFDCDYRLDLSGSNLEQLANSAAGSATFAWKDGTLRSLRAGDAAAAPLTFQLWSGKLTVQDRSIALSDTKMISLSGIRNVSGRISFARDWDLTSAPPNNSGVVAADVAPSRSISANLPKVERVETRR